MTADTRPQAFTTEHGMMWYPDGATTYISVTRMANLYGSAVLGLDVRAKPDHLEVGDLPRLQISVSPGGRSVRVWRQRLMGEPWVELRDQETT